MTPAYRPYRGNRGTSTHFPCGHPRTTENFVGKPQQPSCKTCKRQRERNRVRTFRCGHPKTNENSVPSGHRYRTCRQCKRLRDERYNQTGRKRAMAGHDRPRRPRMIPMTEPVLVCRAAKAVRTPPPSYLQLMAEAKQEYRALLERERENSKGGRPKNSGRGGQKTLVVPRSRRPVMPNVVSDKADALVNILGPFYGSGAA